MVRKSAKNRRHTRPKTCWKSGIVFAVLMAATNDCHAQEIPPSTVCVFDASNNPLRHSVVEYLNPVTGKWDKYSTEVNNCVTSEGVAVDVEEIPIAFALDEIIAWPNPATSDFLNLEMTLSKPTSGRLNIYTVDGRRVSHGSAQFLSAGKHVTELDLSGFAAGMYFARFESENGRSVTGSFVDLNGSGISSARVARAFRTTEEFIAGKSGGVALITTRVTSAGMRQKISSAEVGLNETVNIVLEPGHELTLYIREMSDHNKKLNGGQLLITEGRTGLEQMVHITQNPISIFLPSDSVALKYTNGSTHTFNRISLQRVTPPDEHADREIDIYGVPAVFNVPLTMTEGGSVDHVGGRGAPWYLERLYDDIESSATLFALKDEFPLDELWDIIEFEDFAPTTTGGNYVFDFNSNKYYGEFLFESALIGGEREFVVSSIESPVWDFPFNVQDSLHIAFGDMFPSSYDNTWVDLKIRFAFDSVESFLHDGIDVVNDSNIPVPIGNYFYLVSNERGTIARPIILFDGSKELAVHDYALIAASLENVLSESDPDFSFIDTNKNGDHVNRFATKMLEWKAVVYGLGRMRANIVGSEERVGKYLVFPNEIVGGWASIGPVLIAPPEDDGIIDDDIIINPPRKRPGENLSKDSHRVGSARSAINRR